VSAVDSVSVTAIDSSTWLVTPPTVLREGVVFHGYGSDRDEFLPLARTLSERLSARLAVPDLAGHGSSPLAELTASAAAESAGAALALLDRPTFAVGHSMGARLAFGLGLDTVVGISVPGEAVFEGSPREMLRLMRARRVRERAPYAGVRDVLGVPSHPAPNTLLIEGELDLATVVELGRVWTQPVGDHTPAHAPDALIQERPAVDLIRLAGRDHRDIMDDPALAEIIAAFVEGVPA